MARLPLIKIDDDSVGVILPEEMLAQLGVAEGDELVLSEEPGGIYLRTAKREVARQD
jgi:antitoxin component of MazEF toxin-antitoxin module